ncbi:MAG: hypothetical protein MUP49_04905 [Dehalococcoidia bacterium]|nr:hypothetical protein [Dehalococcoidia bacterium]
MRCIKHHNKCQLTSVGIPVTLSYGLSFYLHPFILEQLPAAILPHQASYQPKVIELGHHSPTQLLPFKAISHQVLSRPEGARIYQLGYQV